MDNLAINITSTKPVISTNFDDLKQKLESFLTNFDFIVNEEDVPKAKSDAKLINDFKNKIDKARKEKVKEISKPIENFNSKAKELIELCDNTRTKILNQTKKFEDEKRQECLTRLKDELKNQYEAFGVLPEFQNVNVEDLAIISNLNKTGVAKKAIDEIKNRVSTVIDFQKKIENRISELNTYCQNRGLSIPLKIDNIKHFLYKDSDELYYDKLNLLIKSELERLRSIQEKLEKEKRLKEITTQTKGNKSISNHNSSTETAIKKTEDGKAKYTVTATFDIEVDEKYENVLEKVLLDKFAKAVDINGKKVFKSIPNVYIEKHLGNGVKQGSLF